MQHRQYHVYQKFLNKHRRGGIVVVSREFEEPSYFEGPSPKRFEDAGAYLCNVLPSVNQILPRCKVPDYDKSKNLKPLTTKEEGIVLGIIASMRRRGFGGLEKKSTGS